MSEVEIEIGPITDRDLGHRGKQHRLGFTKVSSPKQSSTSVEYLTDEELWDLMRRLNAYADGLIS